MGIRYCLCVDRLFKGSSPGVGSEMNEDLKELAELLGTVVAKVDAKMKEGDLAIRTLQWLVHEHLKRDVMKPYCFRIVDRALSEIEGREPVEEVNVSHDHRRGVGDIGGHNLGGGA